VTLYASVVPDEVIAWLFVIVFGCVALIFAAFYVASAGGLSWAVFSRVRRIYRILKDASPEYDRDGYRMVREVPVRVYKAKDRWGEPVYSAGDYSRFGLKTHVCVMRPRTFGIEAAQQPVMFCDRAGGPFSEKTDRWLRATWGESPGFWWQELRRLIREHDGESYVPDEYDKQADARREARRERKRQRSQQLAPETPN
jgi:hypothetical protein